MFSRTDDDRPTLRPSVNEFFPVFSRGALEHRLTQSPFHEATLLCLENIRLATAIHGPDSLRRFLRYDLATQQQLMEQALRAGGISEPTASAIGNVPRDQFVAETVFKPFSNLNHSIPFGPSSWLTPQYLVGLMIDRLKAERNHNILEVGAGGGYHMACIHRKLQGNVRLYGIEINADHVRFGHLTLDRFDRFGTGIRLVHGDGSLGWPDRSKRFDRIYCTAALRDPLRELPVRQLRNGGLVQCVRVLKEHEFAQYPPPAPIRKIFPSYQDYRGGSWRNFCCIASLLKQNGEFIEIDRLYDARFVYLHHNIRVQRDVIVRADPFQDLRTFLFSS